MIPLLVIIVLVAILDWIAVARGWKRIEYVAKPAVMVLLLAELALTGWPAFQLVLFSLGVFFSLLGDVFLMLPSTNESDRWFIPGLASFLLAHIAYILGLSIPLPGGSPILSVAVAIVLGLASARLIRRIIAGIQRQGHKRLILPVEIYGVVITVMLLCAFLTLYSPHWNPTAAVVVALGAMFFFFSDFILASNKFVAPIKNGRVINMVLYHLGQIGLVAGIILQYGK